MASAQKTFLRFLACLAALVVVAGTTARAQGYGDGFDPNGNSNVYAMVRQPDGKLIVGGNFTLLEHDHFGSIVSRQRIARINLDGTVDSTFDTYTDGDISALALQPDGKILVAGKFTFIGSRAGQFDRTGIARLNADGTVDPTFVQVNPVGFGYYPQAIVRAVALQADGKILIGGSFTTVQPDGTSSPVTRNRIARLNSDGTLDTAFDVGANNTVLAFLVEPDGKILVGGGFTTIRPTGATTATTRNRIARLNGDGTLDTDFAPGLDNRVLAFARQADGKILVGGEFARITPAGTSTSNDAAFVLRLTPAGGYDNAFKPLPNAAVETIAVQTDGRILIGGRFTWVRSSGSSSSSTRVSFARLFASGELDPDFFPNPNAAVTSTVIQPDGSIVIAGYFTGVGNGSGGESRRGRIARVFRDGSLDVAFRSGTGGSVIAVAEEADGNLLVAGSYASLGGVTRFNFSRIAPDGTVSTTFTPQVNGSVFAIRVLSDGRILIGGNFTRVNGELVRYIARLEADGTLDATFDPKPNATVYAIAPQSDGKILIGGNFTSIQPDPDDDALTRRYIARLNANGTVDEAFDPSPNLTVNSIVVQPDGKILIGGDFYTLQPNAAKNATSYYYVARLNADGTPEESFTPRPNASVARVLLESDGKIVICGSFTSVLPGRDTTATTRRYIARVNADGTLDTAFDPNPNGQVYNVERFSDGRYLAHGVFQMFQPNGATTWTERPYLAWINADGTLDAARALRPDTALSVSKILASGQVLIGSSFTRLTSASGAVTLNTDILTRVANDATVDPAFVLQSSGVGTSYVGGLVAQTAGRIYAVGSFSDIGGSTNAGISRFYSDGVPDNNFSTKADAPVHAVAALETSDDEEEEGGPVAWLEPNGEYRTSFARTGAAEINGDVYCLAVQSDGKVLVGGQFSDTSVNTTGNLARLNADGTFDTTFNPEPDAAVQSVAVLTDGRIIAAGNFKTINGTARDYLARLTPGGTLDTAWAPTPNGTVLTVLPLADGKVLVGGLFTTFRPNGASSAVTRSYVARINPDGTVDTAFNPEVNGSVNRIAVQSDGRILLAGTFTTVKGQAREYLARVDENGALDTSFYPKPDATVERLALTSSGAMIVTGQFTSFERNNADTTIARSYVARINADGSLDETFHPTPNNWIEDVAIDSTGGVLLAGQFTAFQLEEGGSVYRRNFLARFLADGTLDQLYNPNANGTINAISLRPDSSLVIAGSFDQLRPASVVIAAGEFLTIGDAPIPYLARLNGDGSVDAYFNAAPNAPVRALGEQSDGALIAAGDFTEMAGVARTRVARLYGDADLDLTFTPAVDGAVHSVAVQADDRVLIGGDFATVGAASRPHIARLLANGTLDAGFTASTDGRVSTIAAQADGRILIAGAFTQVNGTARPHLARLAADGTLDASFAPSIDGAVHAVAVQADGRILIGGAFTQVGGQPRARFARLLASGAVDTSLIADADGDVRALLTMPDGRIVVGGAFTQFDGRRMLMLSRISNPTPAVQSATLSSDLSTFTWTSSGSSAVFSAVEIAQSEDGETWTNIGSATRTGSGAWQLAGLTGYSADSFNYVRARAVQASAPGGSVGRVEMAWQFYGSTPAGPATLLNSGGVQAGWDSGYFDPNDSGSSGGGSGGGGSGGSGGGSGGDSGSGGDGGVVPTSRDYHLSNLSIRAWPLDGQSFIAGLALNGTAAEKILVRSVGPGLAAFGVDPVMTAPRIKIFNSAGTLLYTASSWTGDTAVSTTADLVGAFPLDPTSDDSAVVRTLDPGQYTIHVDAGSGLNGIALGEVYFAGAEGGLANFSARAQAGAGTAACVAGFVVGGDKPRRFLVRGIGPGLLAFGISDAPADTVLRLYNGDGVEIAFNDNWQQQADSTAAEVSSAAATAGAFPLSSGAKDAAIVIELAPGPYTVHVGGTVAGTVLAEVYELP